MKATYHLRARGKGKWQIVIEQPTDHTTGKRNRIYKTVSTSKREAEQIALKIISQIQTDSYIKPTKLSVREFMNTWYNLYLCDKSPTTLNGYRYQIDNYIIPMLGNIFVQDLNTISISEWLLC